MPGDRRRLQCGPLSPPAAGRHRRSIAAVRRRFGYRRLHNLLPREGIALNHKKLRRLYAEERLQVRHRGRRKRALGTRRRWPCRRARTSAGRSIICPIS
jgi:putative transposase